MDLSWNGAGQYDERRCSPGRIRRGNVEGRAHLRQLRIAFLLGAFPFLAINSVRWRSSRFSPQHFHFDWGLMIQPLFKKNIALCSIALALFAPACLSAQTSTASYDLLLQNGHVLDRKNHIDAVMDVALKDGKVAKVAAHIPSSAALKTIDVKG